MRRFSTLLLTSGLGLLVTGALFMILSLRAEPPTALAALPDNHPDIARLTAVSGSPAHLPSSKADFFIPGTQPNPSMTDITDPFICSTCHSGYSYSVPQPSEYEPWTGWQGSMMAQAGRDPIFYAALDIAGADAQMGGEFCLRCHLPKAWLEGRIVNGALAPDPENGADLEGVQCEVCHRMVDPQPGPQNHPRDGQVVAALTSTIPIENGNVAMVFDSEDYRRGPFEVFTDGNDLHEQFGAEGTIQSAYHQESAFCGTCHDISNPLLSWNAISQTYALNPLGQPFTDTANMFPIERTFSEWKLSDYNTVQGVYAPQFGGNKTNVSTCQDCHMRDVTGKGGSSFGSTGNVPLRDDMPLHDLTGANTFVPQIIPQHPVFSATFNNEESRLDALNAGIERARTMLQNAASLAANFDENSNQLNIRVVNNSGHKLPTGYVEGRRMWLQIEAYDADRNLIYTSGAYDAATGELTADADIQVYESLQGVTPAWANTLSTTYGLPINAGESFHFVLNNVVIKDNRLPPRGFEYDTFLAAGAAPISNSLPDPTLYADGQYWDDVLYNLPAGVAYGRVRLLHQVASKEYIEFLRDNNPNVSDPNNNGEILYDLWEANGKSEPEVMVERYFGNEIYLPITTRD